MGGCRKQSVAQAEFQKHCRAGWTLTRWVDQGQVLPLPDAPRVTLACREDGLVEGRSFVNSYAFSAPTGPNRLVGHFGAMSALASSRSDLMRDEQRYLRLLRQVQEAQRVGDKLVLSSKEGTSRLEYGLSR